MTKARRLVALLSLVAGAAIVSSFTLGQSSGKKTDPAVATPQLGFGKAPAKADTPEIADRFTGGGVLTYQPVKGETHFALQVKHDLKKQEKQPRDYVILVSGSAAMGGSGWIGACQIAEGLVQTGSDRDSVSLWIVGDKADKARTRNITHGPLNPVDDKIVLGKYIKILREKEYPSGADDLPYAVEQALAALPAARPGRQQLIVYLGNGQSLLNPLSADDRQALADKLVARRVAFFPVPLGQSLTPVNLHGLATATGGCVLRTLVEKEKLVDALKRYEEAFAGTILYEPKLQMPAEVVAGEFFPTKLPPLRGDAPTLVVGKMKPASAFKYTVTGVIAGVEGQTTVTVNETLRAADLDNYFLVSMVQQWRKAADRPAVLRADRTLALAYENTRLKRDDTLTSAQLALEKNDLEAANRFYQDVRTFAPDDPEAESGIKVIDKLRKGTLTPELLRRSMEKSGLKADQMQMDKTTGKVRWNKGNLVNLVAQLDEKDKKAGVKDPVGGDVANPNPDLERDLLKAHRDRMIIEQQKMNQAIDSAIQIARKDLGNDPEGVLEGLRNLLARIKDHPDIGEKERDILLNRLQTQLRQSAGDARNIKLTKEYAAQALAVAQSNQEKVKQNQTFQDRLEAQFRAFRSLMNEARFETSAMNEMLKGMVDMQTEAKVKGNPIPQASQAAYTITQSAYQINQLDTLRRRRNEGFLSVMLSIEKSHVPFPDEPGIYFPPLATWKAIEKLRKDKYETSALPNDDAGRKDAKAIEKLLEEVIETKGFNDPLTLKDALQLFYEKFAAKGKDLPIMVDIQAFKTEEDAAPNPYDSQVQLPVVPRQMTLGTALRLLLAQVTTNNATYLIRRNFIEITTNERALADKVLRVYPVGDLVIPISQPGMPQNGGQFGGGQGGGGGVGGGMMGMGGGMMGMGGGMMGNFGMGGGFGMGNFGGGMGFGGGMMGFGGGMMGFGGGMMGGGMMGFGGGMMGFGGGMMGGGMMGFGGGMMGMGMMGGGMMGMGGGQFQGGAFQGGFNGSLGQLGASQAYGLIQLITRVVDPGRWFYTIQPSPFMMRGMMGMMGMGGMMGMMGMGGMMGNPFMMGMMGNPFMMMGNPFMMQNQMGPPPPVAEGGPADLRTANTIEFFPPALALIIRAPSRIHYSPYGGIVGGKAPKMIDAAAWAETTGRDLIAARDPKAKGRVGAGAEVANAKKPADLDPTKIWEDALTQGSVEPGLVLATADFLFQYGYLQHAVEFLKANLRHGVVVRPWVYEALAIALEASGGDPEEIRRARLSAVALDPTDAQGFLKAAETLANNKEYDKALSFCRQAAQLEPNLAVSYRDALAYADLGKDVRSMEWAVGKLMAQDWPTDNVGLQHQAALRVSTLSDTLINDKHADEAAKLKAVLQQFRQRDLIVKLTWNNASATVLSELEMVVKEPTGSICSDKQKQTPAGGTMIGCDLYAKTKDKSAPPTFAVNYTAGEGFNGEYEITVRRLWGEPVQNRARLEIVLHAGTPQEKRHIEVVDLAAGKTFKVALKNGRRTELATVSPANEVKKQEAVSANVPANNAWLKLRQLANPDFVGAKSIGGGSSSPGAAHFAAMAPSRTGKRLSVNEAPLLQTAVKGSAVNMTAQVRPSDAGGYEMVMQPIFQAMGRGNRAGGDLSVIPGGN